MAGTATRPRLCGVAKGKRGEIGRGPDAMHWVALERVRVRQSLEPRTPMASDPLVAGKGGQLQVLGAGVRDSPDK